MRLRSFVAAAIVGVSSVVLAVGWPMPGLAAPEPPDIRDRFDLYHESLDQRWDAWVGYQYPDAVRPAVHAVEVLPPDQRDVAYARCLEDLGYTVTEYSEGIGYEAPADVDPEVAATGEFACTARYPFRVEFDVLMSVEQRSALYDYVVGVLPTCLRSAGARVTGLGPSRADFIASSIGWPSWTPYQSVWDNGADQEQYELLEQRCPSEPAWRQAMMTPDQSGQ